MLRLLALASFAAAALISPMACAQDATFYTVSYVEVGPVLAKVGAATLHAYREGARKDPGVASLEVFQRTDRPNQFAVLGAWANQMAYEAHSSGEHAKKLNEKIASMLASPVDTRMHKALAAAPAKSAKDPVVVITHVDCLPAEKDNAANAMEQLADQSRRHAGNVQFDVWQQTDRPNHFTIVEAWANRGAFDLHQMQKDTREFRSKLAPMVGSPYDERLYKALK